VLIGIIHFDPEKRITHTYQRKKGSKYQPAGEMENIRPSCRLSGLHGAGLSFSTGYGLTCIRSGKRKEILRLGTNDREDREILYERSHNGASAKA
jgi:hypothetical protein